VVVGGDVQGVFFRDSCRREARRAGLTGWVGNRADGRVEAWFEGPPEAVDRLVAWCRKGPPRARVESVEVTQETPAGLGSFGIR
jgi:acylphosphatase